MPLPEADVEYLESKGYNYELIPFKDSQLLIIHEYQLPTAYTPRVVDMLIMLPAGYPTQNPDMFFTKPTVTLVNGNPPLAASGMVNYHTEGWQQFSRHFNSSKWRPGIDGLAQFMASIQQELEKGL